MSSVNSSEGNTIFSMSPAAALQTKVTFQIRVKMHVQSSEGSQLAYEYTTPSGFTTSTLTFISAGSTTGDLGGVAGADNACITDANYPGEGTFKAMVVDNISRTACTTANCSGGTVEHTDWVFQADRAYYRSNGTTTILTTNADGIFVFGTLTNSFTGTGENFWTGLSTDWRTNVTNYCSSWSDGSGGDYGSTGDGNSNDGASINDSAPSCNTTRKLICVQQ